MKNFQALFVTLRLFATRGFLPTQAKPASAVGRLGFCLRSSPSALLTTAPRFYEISAMSKYLYPLSAMWSFRA